MMDEHEFAIIEDHLLWCLPCVEAAIEAAHYVDAIRAAIIVGDFDL